MTNEEMIKQALEADIDLPREEYAAKCTKADAMTAANGIEGKAPINEEDRERRMRMNYYGITINLMMNMLAAIDELANRVTMLNNNLVSIAGGGTDGGITNDPDSGITA